MHRLFTAVRPPAHVRATLLAAMGGISGARWLGEDQLHLTLRFIGEVDRHQARDIHAALGAVHHPRFDLALSGLGAFDRRGQVEVVWAGVTPQDAVKALHRKIDQALTRAGVAPDRRAYAPHITMARMKRGAGPVRHLVEQSGGLSSPPFTVESFTLYESQLTPEGPIYTAVERYPLD